MRSLMRGPQTAAVVAGLVLASCRYQPTPVQLMGGSADITALAGTWTGSYAGTESGRSGDITFVVRAGTDTAFGDVLMQSSAGQQLTPVDAATRAHDLHVSRPELLRVTFVRVSGGYVEGALEPYIAPDCQCPVSTVFRGIVQVDTIRGEFTTRGELGLRQTGSWSVARRR